MSAGILIGGINSFSLIGSFEWKSTAVTVPLCPGNYQKKKGLWRVLVRPKLQRYAPCTRSLSFLHPIS